MSTLLTVNRKTSAGTGHNPGHLLSPDPEPPTAPSEPLHTAPTGELLEEAFFRIILYNYNVDSLIRLPQHEPKAVLTVLDTGMCPSSFHARSLSLDVLNQV